MYTNGDTSVHDAVYHPWKGVAENESSYCLTTLHTSVAAFDARETIKAGFLARRKY